MGEASGRTVGMGGVSAVMIAGTSVDDLSIEIVISHLHARALTEATGVIDIVSSRVMEAQRFAGARFREAVAVARRSQRQGRYRDDSM